MFGIIWYNRIYYILNSVQINDRIYYILNSVQINDIIGYTNVNVQINDIIGYTNVNVQINDVYFQIHLLNSKKNFSMRKFENEIKTWLRKL